MSRSRATRSLFRRLLKNPTGLVSMVFLALVVAGRDLRAAAGARTTRTVASARTSWPARASDHPLGADGAGRDVLSRLLYATRFSLAGALLALVIAAVIGVTSGLIAGYYQRLVRARRRPGSPACSWRCPASCVLLAARAVLGPSMWMVDGDLRCADLAGVLPARLRRGHRRPARALRRRRPGRRAQRRPHHRPAHPHRGPGAGRSSRRRWWPASRSPSRPVWTSWASAT